MEVQRIAERQLLGDARVEGPPAAERTVLVADIGGELLVPKERVRDAEREVKGGDADGAREHLVAQLLCGPARRVIGEARVHPGGADAVAAPVGGIRDNCDYLPALVACAPGC